MPPVRRVLCAGTAGACGLVLFAAGAGHAQAAPRPAVLPTQTVPRPSVLSTLVGADLGTVTTMTSGVVCDNRLADFNYKSPVTAAPHPCVNGPVHSGNSVDSGNFVNHGNPNGSGNIANTNGSTNSADTVTGPSSHSGNTGQGLVGGGL